METQSQQVNEEKTPIVSQVIVPQVNEEIPAIAKSQARVTRNPRNVAAGRKDVLARKAKLIHN